MNIVVSIHIDAKAKSTVQDPYGPEPLFAPNISILGDRCRLEIETDHIGEIHPVLDEISPPLGLVPKSPSDLV